MNAIADANPPAMYDHKSQGQQFVTYLIWLLLASTLVYVLSHVVIREAVVDWTHFADVDARGDVRYKNLGEIDWYIGTDRAEEIIERTRERSEAMLELRVTVQSAMLAVRDFAVDQRELDAMTTLVNTGDYEAAAAELDRFLRSLADDSYAELSREAGVQEASSSLIELSGLKRAQADDVSLLEPPLAKMFFWTSPTLSIMEVLFWSLFGVVTNLLVNSVEFLRTNNFRPVERWVAYTKLVYGPILSMVLVIAMINGWFQVDSYELRVWSLPLVGFVFGYATRRTAMLFDKLIEKFLGRTEAGIDAGPEAVRARHLAMVNQLKQAMQPRTFGELREQAKTLAAELTEAATAAKEASR